MLTGVKVWLAQMGERHPLGYRLAVALMNRTDLFLPHETDYLAFPRICRAFDGLFLDVGANQGHSARGFAKLVPGRRIVSIEANVYHQPALERVRRRLPDYAYRIAVADRVSGRTIEFFTPIYHGIVCHSAAAATWEDAADGIRSTWPRLFPAFRFEKTVAQTIAIDDLDLPVAVAKMDIQGNELAALQGCRRTIERYRPAFLIEFGNNLERLSTFFLALGYRPFNFDVGRRQFDPLQVRPLTRNLFFFPEERCAAVLAAAA